MTKQAQVPSATARVETLFRRHESKNLSSHILPTSATMVGVCMTVIGIIRLVHAGTLGFYFDKLLAVDSILFVGSSVLSFVAMRQVAHSQRTEVIAELLFLLGLLLMGIASIVLAFEFV